MITQKQLHDLLTYDPGTGDFRWLNIKPGRVSNGDIAGTVSGTGYRQIAIRGKIYLSHRLAWLYVYGYFPESDVDHIDRCRINNMINNLRVVSRSCNMRNRSMNLSKKSGVKGVYSNRKKATWLPQITVNSSQINLGSYKCFGEAVCHRLAAEQAEGWAGCDSSSPAYQYVKKHIQHGG